MLRDLLDKGKCLMGLHQGDWAFDSPSRCTQTRVCAVCGAATTQVEHRWGDWEHPDAGACEQVRRCARCGERETRVVHAWTPWEYSEPHRAPIRACERCGMRASRFSRQAIGAAEAGSSAPPLATDSPPAEQGGHEEDDLAGAGIARLVAGGDTAALVSFVKGCADVPLKPTVLEAVSTGLPEMQLLGLCMLADPYCRGLDPPLGLAIVRAVYARARQLHTQFPARQYLDTAAQAAGTALLGLSAQGKHGDAVRFGREASAWLEGEGHIEKRASLLMSRIDAHLALGEFDDAGALLAEAEAIDLPPEQFADRRRLQDLRRTFDKMARQSATELPRAAPSDAAALAAARSDLAGQIQQLQGFMTGQESASIQGVVNALAAEAQTGAPESQAAWAVQSQPLADALTEILSGGAGGMTQLRNRNRTIKAALIFADPATANDRTAIEQSLAVLLEARAWAKGNECASDEGTALWGMYLCYSRSGRPGDAIDALQALRANLEARRRQISDPLERAGAMADYPHLFPALCQQLCRAGRAGELLGAMEGAKGRVLSDVLTAARGEVIPDSVFIEPVPTLASALKPLNAHYLSYFVDDDETYAAVVTKHGETHCTSIPIGRARLRMLVASTDPKTWNRSRSGLFGGPKPQRLPEQLAPLVQWLEPLVAAGVLAADDHLCYCPDDELHLVPLHYLPLAGRPLVEHVSVSRIHSAAALMALLHRTADCPTEFVAAQVPAQQDLEDREKLTRLARVSGWLGEHLSGRTLARERATLDALATLDLTGRVVHFATHGTFPLKDQPGRNPNPFHASGLAFAHDGALPSLARVAAGEADATLLTPARVLTLDFGRSHVTLQACVSGLAKEGIGGDALGLELALLLAGAQSVLTSHWNIPADASAEFSVRFYRRWLLDGETRARAWRAAVLELASENAGAAVPAEYYWAGFSLSGDWR